VNTDWLSAGRAAVVVLAASLLTAGCAQEALSAPGSGSTSTPASSRLSGIGEITSIPRGRRVPAPALSGTDLSGRPVALSDFRGRVVVLNVWASWCGPCRAEAPGLEHVFAATRSLGVQFLGVDTRDDDDSARAFVRKFKITYPSIVDHDGGKLLPFARLLPVQAVPSTLVIDRTGQVAVRALTPLTEQQLREAVQEVLAEAPSPAPSPTPSADSSP
jgi:thiol-disulfide isomerase/thioredoxin